MIVIVDMPADAIRRLPLSERRLLAAIIRPRCAIRLSPGWVFEVDGLIGQYDEEVTDPWRLA